LFGGIARRGTSRSRAPSRVLREGRAALDGVYKLVRRYALALGLKIGAHALRATAATNALDHDADIAKVQECFSIRVQSNRLRMLWYFSM
jgi:integrase